MKYAYKDMKFRKDTLKLIELINSIIATYQRQGFVLSVRQLYYQLVARALIENTEKSYKRIASVINDGRIGGYIDWDAIEDRGRDIELRTRWSSGSQIVRAAADGYHMDMWVGQEARVFVIVEKAALAGVLSGICRQYDVPLLAARGYPSVSVVREMVMDHFRPAIKRDQTITILHLGDHDPSGIDMTRDLDERIGMFLERDQFEASVHRIALTMPQIEEKEPPPNPAKTTDSRFDDYMRRFGHESWELDALEPAFLVDLVRGQIEEQIDWDQWNHRRDHVEHIRTKLTKVADEFESA